VLARHRIVGVLLLEVLDAGLQPRDLDRKSTRLNSSHRT